MSDMSTGAGRTTATATPTHDGGTAGQAREQVGRVAEHGRQEAAHVAHTARSETEGLVRKTGEEAKRRAEEQGYRMAGMLSSLAEELDEIGSTSDGRSGYLSSIAHDGAQVSRRMSERLEHDGLDGAIDDVRGFARRRPGTFLAAAFGVGLLMGRLTRNADMHRIADEARHDREGGNGPSTAAQPGRQMRASSEPPLPGSAATAGGLTSTRPATSTTGGAAGSAATRPSTTGGQRG